MELCRDEAPARLLKPSLPHSAQTERALAQEPQMDDRGVSPAAVWVEAALAR